MVESLQVLAWDIKGDTSRADMSKNRKLRSFMVPPGLGLSAGLRPFPRTRIPKQAVATRWYASGRGLSRLCSGATAGPRWGVGTLWHQNARGIVTAKRSVLGISNLLPAQELPS